MSRARWERVGVDKSQGGQRSEGRVGVGRRERSSAPGGVGCGKAGSRLSDLYIQAL